MYRVDVHLLIAVEVRLYAIFANICYILGNNHVMMSSKRTRYSLPKVTEPPR